MLNYFIEKNRSSSGGRVKYGTKRKKLQLITIKRKSQAI